MRPPLAAGDHDRAVQAGVDAVLAAIGGVAPPIAQIAPWGPAPPSGRYQQRRMPF
jgi:hypothetical protein